MVMNLGPPQIDFSALANLGDPWVKAMEKQHEQELVAGLIKQMAGGDQAAPAPVAPQVPAMAGGNRTMRMPADPEVVNKFVETWKAGGLTNPVALAGLAAQVQAESGFNPVNFTRTWSDPSESGKPGTSGGALSWRGDRLTRMLQATEGQDPVVAQAKYALVENPELTIALQNAKTPEEVNTLLGQSQRYAGYNRPGGENARRLDLTRSFLPQVGGAQAATAAVSSSPASAGDAQTRRTIATMMQIPSMRATALGLWASMKKGEDTWEIGDFGPAGKGFFNKRTRETVMLPGTARPEDPKTTTVAPGSAVVDQRTGRTIYQAPDRDKATEQESKLRAEFDKNAKSFNAVQDAYGRVVSAVQQREGEPGSVSPASDVALIFGYMKMLDPDSVVREGEYATAQNAGSIPERVQNIYNKALKGEFLTPEQRQDFVDTAGRLYGQARGQTEKVAERFRKLAPKYGADPDRVVYMPEAIQPPKIGPARTPSPPKGGKPVEVDGYMVKRLP